MKYVDYLILPNQTYVDPVGGTAEALTATATLLSKLDFFVGSALGPLSQLVLAMRAAQFPERPAALNCAILRPGSAARNLTATDTVPRVGESLEIGCAPTFKRKGKRKNKGKKAQTVSSRQN